MPSRFFACLMLLVASATVAFATNAVPYITQPLYPTTIAAGSPAFTLIIRGVGFGPNAKVLWNGVAHKTTYDSTEEVTAVISAADVAIPGTILIQVQNDTPGGGISNAVSFPIGVSKTSLTGVNSTAPAASGMGFSAVGDFNNDGILDVAAVNPSAGTVSVFLGLGNATFASHVDYSVGTQPVYVATGDFNGDGNLDLVVANQGSNNVSVLLGNGDGTFQAAINSLAGSGPTAVAAADFNHDGKLDVVVPNPTSDTISVLLGNGDGSFGTPIPTATGTYPVHVAVADFNGDDYMDVVVADSNCATTPCGMGSISLLRGLNNGSFSGRHDFQADIGTSFVLAAGYDGNYSATDVIAVNPSVSGGNGSISYFRNTGAGTFASPVETSTGANSTAAVAGDFNDDGKLDVAVLNSGGAGLTLLFGNNNGTFGGNGITYSDFTFTANTTGLAVGDFNNDGQLDFVSSDSSGFLEILTQQQAPAGASLSTTSLNFGVQPVEIVSPTKHVTLTNSGGAALNISSIVTSPSQYIESTTCPSSLAGGVSCTINVAFDPTSETDFNGTVTITDNAANSPQTISLSGVGSFAEYSASSFNFGNVAVGATGSLTMTMTNLSLNTMKITGVSIHGTGAHQFSQTNNCSGAIAGKSSCTFTVNFSPSFTGTRNATLTISTSESPQADFALTGTGVED